jgi:hypothetical protein
MHLCCPATPFTHCCCPLWFTYDFHMSPALQLSEVPLSRCWKPEDWAAHRVRQAARAAAAAAPGGAQARTLRALDMPPVVATGANAWVDSWAPEVRFCTLARASSETVAYGVLQSAVNRVCSRRLHLCSKRTCTLCSSPWAPACTRGVR